MRVFIRYCGYELYTYAEECDNIIDTVSAAIRERVKMYNKTIGEVKYKGEVVYSFQTFDDLGVEEDDLIFVSNRKVSLGFNSGQNVLLYN